MSKPIRRLTVEIISSNLDHVVNIARTMVGTFITAEPNTYVEMTLHPVETAEEAIKNIASTEK